MTCDELRDSYGAFAVGSLEESEERTDLRAHLERQCPNCVPGVRNAMGTVTVLAGAVEIKDPPKRLRRRVAALVNPNANSSKSWIFPWVLAGLLAVTVLSIAIPARRQAADTVRLEEALSILNDPATKDVSFGETEKPSRGRVFVSPSKGVVFIGASLPKLPEGRAFELWTIPASGRPVPQGTFKPDTKSAAVYVRSGPVEVPQAVAVSIEPEAGSLQPTTTPFIVTKVTAF